MTATFKVKQGDNVPRLGGVCQRAGSIVDLSGATVTVRMTPEHPGLAPDIDAAATIIGDPADGSVEYAWQPGDTDVPGLYRAEFHVVHLDGSAETFPTDGYIAVEVERRALAG